MSAGAMLARDGSESDVSTFDRLKEAYSEPWVDLKQGRTFQSYLLTRRIGRGRYAEVWLAEDKNLGRDVAVKVFTPLKFTPEDQAEAAERFYKGATAMAKLNHKNVARLCSSPTITDGYLWVAMTYYEDGDLGNALENAVLTEAELVRIFCDVLAGISHAHQAGVIHRDIRPSNILLDRSEDGSLTGVLADFDMAYWDHLLFQDMSTLSIPSIARYVPEDLLRAGKGHPAQKTMMRRRSNDVFAAAVVLLDMFTTAEASAVAGDEGHFQRLLTQAGRKSRGGTPPSPELRNRVARILAIGLRAHEAERFTTIADLQAAWQGLGHESRMQFVFGLAAIASLIATMVIALDYGLYGTRGTHTSAVLTAGISALSGLSILSLPLWVLGKWFKTLTGIRLYLGTLLYATRRRQVLAIGSMLLLPALALFLCAPKDRVGKLRVAGGAGCRLVDATGKQLRVIKDNDSQVVAGDDATRLLCPKVTRLGVTVDELSMITPGVRVDDDVVDAGVDARIVGSGSAMAPSLPPQRVTPESPPTEEAIEEQLLLKLGDSTIRARLDTLGMIWPRYMTPARRISYVLNPTQLHELVTLQNDALDIANGPFRLSSAMRSKSTTFIAYKWHALAGHLASLVLKCNKGLSYIGDAIRHDGVDNTLIWIGDVVRCISDADQYQAVRTSVQNLPLRAEGKQRFEGVLVWLAMTQDPLLIKSGVRLRAMYLLEVMGTRWADQRSEVIASILATSGDCDELQVAIELVKKYPVPNDPEKFSHIIANRMKSTPTTCSDIWGTH